MPSCLEIFVANVYGLPAPIFQIEGDRGCSAFSSLERPRGPTAPTHLISPCLLAPRNYVQGFLGDGSQSSNIKPWGGKPFPPRIRVPWLGPVNVTDGGWINQRKEEGAQ